ncbi:MAG TPA: hypothetical protein VFW78_04725 [Bacteroidia bacterium]|nr:hypothetical protein [Bacteroidia bacterium]
MITFDTIKVEPLIGAFEPTLKFEVKFTCAHEDMFPITCSGKMLISNQFVNVLIPFDAGNRGEEHFYSNYQDNRNIRSHHFSFISSLTKTMLHKMEEIRHRNKKSDLILDISIRIKYLIPEFKASNPNAHNSDNLVMLNNYNSLFKICENDFSKTLSINKMDWLHDFASEFRMSEYVVVDLPISKYSKSRNVSIKRINSTFKSIQEMKDCLDDGNWNGVIKASRPIWELFQHREEIISVLSNDGMNQQTVKSFEVLMKALFDFSSKYVHRQAKDSKEVMDPNFAKREDAELMYLISVSVINLLVRKS